MYKFMLFYSSSKIDCEKALSDINTWWINTKEYIAIQHG